jgi:predicted DNA binding CopG/RHH family protein
LIDFESVAGASLSALGYQTFIAPAADTFTKEYLETLETENKAKKLQTRASAKDEDLKARLPQEQLLLAIKQRMP